MRSSAQLLYGLLGTALGAGAGIAATIFIGNTSQMSHPSDPSAYGSGLLAGILIVPIVTALGLIAGIRYGGWRERE